MRNNNSTRILSQNSKVSNNTWKTHVNNNDLIVGTSGGGKTRSYVIPNIIHSEDNLIVTDTKGNLCNHYAEYLKNKGYKVINLDFTDVENTPWGYNPLSYIRETKQQYLRDEGNYYNEQDVKKLAAAICPVQSKEPYWDMAAQMYLESFILYVLNCLPEDQHNLCEIYYMLSNMNGDELGILFEDECALHPKSSFAMKYATIKNNFGAEKMSASIIGILAQHMDAIAARGMLHLYTAERQVDFQDFLHDKTVLFLNVSDSDRSQDALVNIFYTQALQFFMNAADRQPDSRLTIPIRFILDDFSTNSNIPDFDNIISVIRSREIYTSLIVQSISQLQGRYGKEKAQTIINNCDHILYLGGNDPATTDYFAIKANCQHSTIEWLGIGEVYVFARGNRPLRDRLYDIESDKLYKMIWKNKNKSDSNKEDTVKDFE